MYMFINVNAQFCLTVIYYSNFEAMPVYVMQIKLVSFNLDCVGAEQCTESLVANHRLTSAFVPHGQRSRFLWSASSWTRFRRTAARVSPSSARPVSPARPDTSH